MGLKEDLLEMKKEVRSVKEQSLAMEMLSESKKANTKICVSFTIVLIIVAILWGGTVAYLIHTLNDIRTAERTTNTQEIEDVGTIENSNISNGDMYGEDKAN